MKPMREYPLDNSAIIHLATRRKWYCNSFRLAVTLKETVEPALLQQALNTVVPRFPTIAAGIEKNFFRYRVVPVQYAPRVTEEQEEDFLACMTPQQIRSAAFRVLYRGRSISGEFFHALTDGYGALVFMKTLLAEYLKLAHSIEISEHAMILLPEEQPLLEEVKDDFFTYAGEKSAPLQSCRSYQIPAFIDCSGKVMTTSLKYDIQQLLQVAKRHRTSLTVLLTAVMAASVAEIQQKYSKKGLCRRPVQIMVPVNLRNLFPSTTLRNFSLFALPGVRAEECSYPVTRLVKLIEAQMQVQSTAEHMAAIMATHTRADQMPVMKVIPLFLKLQVLKFAQQLYGEPNSSISLSNLGNVVLAEEMTPYVERMEAFLTPRISSPYNCGVVSYDGTCYINFSRFCESAELELCFTKHLQKIMEDDAS